MLDIVFINHLQYNQSGDIMNEIFKNTMANMKWTDIKDAADNNALVLLPLGVIEEHGPQLPLGTDIYTAHLQCLYLKKRLEESGHAAVIAPPFYWGICQSTGSFIGSFKSRKETVKMIVFDIIASLAGFGFRNVYGINAHGDIEHNVALIEAFREAAEKLSVHARYMFQESIMHHYGLTGEEPYICPVKPQTVKINISEVPDVHGGDIETAVMNAFYPELVDIKIAGSLPPVSPGDDKIWDWLLGGHTAELSPDGYLGAPADFGGVDVFRHLEDTAGRLAEAIIGKGIS